VALAFGILALATRATPAGDKVPLAWFGLNFLLLVVGELCLAPVGLSMVTKLSPRRVVGVMMGAFLLAYSASSYLAGVIATFTSLPADGAAVDSAAARAAYVTVYLRLAGVAVVVALVLLALAPLLARLARLPGRGDSADPDVGVAHRA